MKDTFLIILFFCLGFISNKDIDLIGHKGIYNLTAGETYNFYAPVQKMAQIEVDFKIAYFTYEQFNCINISEYSSRNGTYLINYTITDLYYYHSEGSYSSFNIFYDLQNFASNYISFSFKPNSTVNGVEISLSFDGGLYILSNGETKNLGELSSSYIPFYFAIPVNFSKIKVEINSSYYEDFEDLNLTLIEYQKSDLDFSIYEKQEYTNYIIDRIDEDDIWTISFNYFIKNHNTNYFCIRIFNEHGMCDLTLKLYEDRYNHYLYDKQSLDIFDLEQEQNYTFFLKGKVQQVFYISYSIFWQNSRYSQPIESMIIYEDELEGSSTHLWESTHYINSLTDAFLYEVCQSKTKYLSLNINPRFQIKKFHISFNITERVETEINIENNTLFSLQRLYPYITYSLNINSKFLERLKYEIIIKNGNISSPPFDYISLVENPSMDSEKEELTFKKKGKDLIASSSFGNKHVDTNKTTFLIKSNEFIDLLSIQVKVTGANFYYLTKGVKTNIELLLYKEDYYFAIDADHNFYKYKISVNIKYKSNGMYAEIYNVEFYTAIKKNKVYLIGLSKSKRTSYLKNGNEYNLNFDFDANDISYYDKFDILIFRLYSFSNLDNFNIEYKLVEYEYKKNDEKKSNNVVNILLYILVPLAVVISVISLTTYYCKKKKTTSNLIEDNIDINANLVPQ